MPVVPCPIVRIAPINVLKQIDTKDSSIYPPTVIREEEEYPRSARDDNRREGR